MYFIQRKRQNKYLIKFGLSLPLNEIHELGLMYLNYEILLNGYKTIYLGESMPIENLKDLKKHFNSIVFVSYMTVQPERDSINDYVAKMTHELVDDNTELWLTGRLVEFINKDELSDKISIFDSISELIDRI